MRQQSADKKVCNPERVARAGAIHPSVRWLKSKADNKLVAIYTPTMAAEIQRDRRRGRLPLQTRPLSLSRAYPVLIARLSRAFGWDKHAILMGYPEVDVWQAVHNRKCRAYDCHLHNYDAFPPLIPDNIA